MSPTPSPIPWRAFTLPKRGHRPEEYEDAFAANPPAGRFAVADGASESSFAGLWARLLVAGFVRTEEGKTSGGWLAPLQRRWAADVDPLTLPWYAEEKREQGAFATFLGLTLRPGAGGRPARWKALAVGDSCLFHLRQGQLVRSFPVSRRADFGNQPPLLGSRPTNGRPPPPAKLEIGQWQSGDQFYLMTDALAQWFLGNHEDGLKPWQVLSVRLAQADPSAALAAYVEQLRDRREIVNDDVTLLVIHV